MRKGQTEAVGGGAALTPGQPALFHGTDEPLCCCVASFVCNSAADCITRRAQISSPRDAGCAPQSLHGCVSACDFSVRHDFADAPPALALVSRGGQTLFHKLKGGKLNSDELTLVGYVAVFLFVLPRFSSAGPVWLMVRQAFQSVVRGPLPPLTLFGDLNEKPVVLGSSFHCRESLRLCGGISMHRLEKSAP